MHDRYVIELLLGAALVFCFVGTAGLALAEVSIVRVRRSEAIARASEGDRRAADVLALLDDLPVVLNSILFTVLLLQVSAATIGAFLAGRWFGGLGVTFTTLALTLALFVYAEAIPKTMAVRAPYPMSVRVAPALKILARVTRPVVGALVALANLQSPGDGANLGAFTEKEIMAVAREAAEAGEIDQSDAELLARSFRFNDRAVGDVMVERNQIAAVSGQETALGAMTTAISAGHRRLPVVDGGLDQMLGVVRLRDLAAESHARSQTRVEAMVTPVLYCSADEQVASLLQEMQRTGRSLAIVADPDGKTLGLVTIEDLVAELVGEISETEPPR